MLLQPRDSLGLDTDGSVSLVSTQLATGLAGFGIRVGLFCRQSAGQADSEVTPQGVEVHRVAADPRPLHSMLELATGFAPEAQHWTLSRGYYPLFLRRTVRALRHFRPDVIHVSTHLQYLSALRASFPQTRIALHLHDELLTHLPEEWLWSHLSRADVVVCVRECVSRGLRDACPRLSGRIATVNLGVDAERFTPPRDFVEGRDRTLLYVGRLSPEKGLHVLARAFATVHHRMPDARLIVAGSQGLMPYRWIAAAATSDPMVATLLSYYGHGLLSRMQRELVDRGRSYVAECKALLGPAVQAVKWLSHVPYAAIPAVYRTSAILVAPSVCNELPTGIAEAMASGMAVVTTYESDAEGIIESGRTSLRARRNDPEQLADVISGLLSEPSRVRDLGTAARTAAVERGTWGHAAKRLLELYRGRLSA